MYHFECECIDEKTKKNFKVVTQSIRGTCPNCGRQYVIRGFGWQQDLKVREKFYACFGLSPSSSSDGNTSQS